MKYAEIERELLAVVFGFESFNQYTYARHVNVEMDHKPMDAITKKPFHGTTSPPKNVVTLAKSTILPQNTNLGKKWLLQILSFKCIF